ncbi:MAG TPA: hypothetical protein VFA81_00505 [Burkholderiales bacterium]|nr:hypothetical protein [Burkholderiales bacterium]
MNQITTSRIYAALATWYAELGKQHQRSSPIWLGRARSVRAIAAACIVLAADLLTTCGSAIAGNAPALHIEVAAKLNEPGGTYHYATELRLSAPGAAPLILKGDEENDHFLPIPGPQYAISSDHALLLGWSSYGGGMETIHGLLLRVDNGHVVLQRELALTAARLNAGLVIRRDGPDKVLLGVAERPDTGHEQDEWSLALGSEKHLNWTELARLPYFPADQQDADVFYFPPIGFDVGHTFRRVAWISASTNGFAILSESSAQRAGSESWAGERWFDAFPAFPGARLLCSTQVSDKTPRFLQNVYVTSSDMGEVTMFYATNAGSTRIAHLPGTMLLSDSEGRSLSVRATSGSEIDCGPGVKPSTHDATYMVVSKPVH